MKSKLDNRRGKTASARLTQDTQQTPEPTLLTDQFLRRWPVPQPAEGGDKEERGRVLIVGGSREMPGALILSATAALRAGAGKLRMATVEAVAAHLGAAVPEARVISLPETKTGAVSPRADARVVEEANKVQAVLIGPGMIDERAVTSLMKRVLPAITRPVVVVDAEALSCFAGAPAFLKKVKGRMVLTPHAEEMSDMIGKSKEAVERGRVTVALDAARSLKAVVVLKGRETLIAQPEGTSYINRAGNVGLATSGSGDVLAGIITGLAARGCDPAQAAVWGVYLHARAGDRLAERVGSLGFLARELLDEIPALMTELLEEA